VLKEIARRGWVILGTKSNSAALSPSHERADIFVLPTNAATAWPSPRALARPARRQHANRRHRQLVGSTRASWCLREMPVHWRRRCGGLITDKASKAAAGSAWAVGATLPWEAQAKMAALLSRI
jgi:hypothetical protein